MEGSLTKCIHGEKRILPVSSHVLHYPLLCSGVVQPAVHADVLLRRAAEDELSQGQTQRFESASFKPFDELSCAQSQLWNRNGTQR